MSKSLPPMLCIAVGAASVTLACEPVSTSLVVVTPIDEGDVADASDAGRKPAAPARDARVADLDAGVMYPELLDPERCLTFFPALTAVEDPDARQRLMYSRKAAALGCGPDDSGLPQLAEVFARRDGKPLFEQGKTYSWRWSAVTAPLRFNMTGGEHVCDRDIVFKREYGYQVVNNTLTPATCHPFVSPIDSDFLGMAVLDLVDPSQIFTGRLELKVCQSSCPPNTMHTFPEDDAGAKQVDASASSMQKPLVIPGLTNDQGGLSIPGLTDDAGALTLFNPPPP